MLFLCSIAAPDASGQTLYVHDTTFLGNIGRVDVTTGNVELIGSAGTQVTDIAFSPDGVLFGTSFNRLFTIDRNTASISDIGAHGIPGANSLVFGTNGVLYASSGTTSSLYEIDPTTAASTNLGDIGFTSAGDLAFNGDGFFLSSSSGELVSVDLANDAAGTSIGQFGFSSVFGLASAENGVLFGVSGSSIFSVDTETGQGTLVSSYEGQGLGAAGGTSFISEAISVPEPSLSPFVFMLAMMLRRRKG